MFTYEHYPCLLKIIPIPKKGDLTSIRNYIPISLLSILSKLLEKLIYDQVITFIRPNLSKKQFGFLKNRSSLSQLLVSYSEIFNLMDRKAGSDVIYLDFSKAFDSVPHQELLYKLWQMGITGPLWHWFKSYLSNHQHCVSIGGKSSKLLPVISGVPQGCILGPMLFIIYVNDLTVNINHSSSYNIFADDTKLIKHVYTGEDLVSLQEDINHLVAWCSKWKLSLNPSKCIAVRFGHCPQLAPPAYQIENCTIEPVKQTTRSWCYCHK